MDGAVKMNGTLPEAFVTRMSRQLGTELPRFLEAVNSVPVRGIRMNPYKSFPGDEIYRKGPGIPWEKNGYVLDAASIAGNTVYHEAGAFYLQEPAAMLPARVMDALPGEKILDLCAAPGGKSTQMGIDMQGNGLLICNEPVAKRAQILSRNIERTGIPNTVVVSAAPESLAEKWGTVFDGVLVDARCSGEGMFRRDPETRSQWSEANAAGCAKRQQDILAAASRLVRPGGRMVYSTCTYNPEENEHIIEWFLHEYPDFEPEPFSLPGAKGENGMLTCYPHRMIGEGQFVAKLRKRGNEDIRFTSFRFSAPPAEKKKAISDILPGYPEANGCFGNLLIRLPECPDLAGIRVVRAGLHLAEIKGKTLVPDHAAALVFSAGETNRKEIGAEDAARYIAGEEINGEESGWIKISFNGVILGWGKGSGGRIRNHYPKGLRKENIYLQ